MNGISCSRINGSDLLFTHTKLKIKPEEENEMTTTRKCKRKERKRDTSSFPRNTTQPFPFCLCTFCGGKNNDVQWQNMAET